MSIQSIGPRGSLVSTLPTPEQISAKIQEIALSVLLSNEQLPKDQIKKRIVEQVMGLKLSPDSSLVEHVRSFLNSIDPVQLHTTIEGLCSTLEFSKVCTSIQNYFLMPLSKQLISTIEQLYLKTLIKEVQKTSHPLASSLGCKEILKKYGLTPSTHPRSVLKDAIKDLFNEQISLLNIYFDFIVKYLPYQKGIAEHQLCFYNSKSGETLRQAFNVEYENFFNWVVENSDKSMDELSNLEDIPNSSFTPFFLEKIKPIYEIALIYRECKNRHPLFIKEDFFHLLIQDWRDPALQPKESITDFCCNLPISSRVFVYSICSATYENRFNSSLFEFVYEEVQKLINPSKEDIENLLTIMEAQEHKTYLTRFWEQRGFDSSRALFPGIFHPIEQLDRIRAQLKSEYEQIKIFLEENIQLSLLQAWDLESTSELITYDQFQDVFLDISDYEELINQYINESPEMPAIPNLKETLDQNSPMDRLFTLFLNGLKKGSDQFFQPQDRAMLFVLQASIKNPPKHHNPVLAKKQADLLKILDAAKTFLKNPLETSTVTELQIHNIERFEYLFYLALATTLTMNQILANGKTVSFYYLRSKNSLPISYLLNRSDVSDIAKKTSNLLNSIFSEEFCNNLPIEQDILSFFQFLKNRFDKKT